MIIFFIILGVGIYFLAGIKVVNEYERGIKFTLGKYSGTMNPGLRIVLPIIESWERVDIRTKVIDVPNQEAITKDNVSVKINAVLYYRITDASLAIIKVRNFMEATSQFAQTTMRNVVGEIELDELLQNRNTISQKISKIVDKETDPWGIKIESVELKHIEVPFELQRVMARQAEAERQKKAVIIKSQGEVSAAKNISEAAKNLSKYPGGLHLRTLGTINHLSADKSKTTIYAIPKELLELVKRFGNKKD
jgi:regulator of protease activity HflC (stomatin/prohibitin superfamily)